MSLKKPDAFIAGKPLAPETLMMSYGYKPALSEGAIKAPIFQSSTFVFKTAEDGKAFFELAYGLREPRDGEEMGLIYSRLNNPDLEILEDRLTLWDEADACAVFASGMAAITTTMLEFLTPDSVLFYSEPLYGGSDHFIRHVLPRFGVRPIGFTAGAPRDELERIITSSGAEDRLAMIYLETPANPTNALVDIRACADIAAKFSSSDRKVVVAVDNTYLGPIFQHPLAHGADLVIYSATKYIGGHSDVIAGAVLGNAALMQRVKTMRTFLGTMATPWTAWLLLRSLETLKIRMETASRGAQIVADWLRTHPKIGKVHYLGHLEPSHPNYETYQRQCKGPGAMISFDVKGGEPEAFRLLNALKIIHLAVSLGGTESLAEHPATMTHSDVSPAAKERMGITHGMVRLSIGLESPTDIIADLNQALSGV